MNKDEFAFFGFFKYGQRIWIHDDKLTHDHKYCYEKVDGNISVLVDGEELYDAIYYDMSDAYQTVAEEYMRSNGYYIDEKDCDFRWCPMDMRTMTLPEVKLPNPKDGETHLAMLRRWIENGLDNYEEIALVENLTSKGILK